MPHVHCRSLRVAASPCSTSSSSPPKPTQPAALLPTYGRQIGASLSATSPAQATQSFVTSAACRARTILALLDVVFLLHAKETLLFFNALAIDAAAADCAVETAETPAGTSNAAARSQAVDAWVLRA